MLLGLNINKAKFRQRRGVLMQAAFDHHPCVNAHLAPQANLSHLTERMKTCLQQLPRLRVAFPSNWYIFIHKRTWYKYSSPKKMKVLQLKTLKGNR